MNSSSYHKSFFSQIPWRNYVNLMRLDRPIGWLLLLWPTWLALWGASQGRPSIKGIVVFTLGVVLMRSAGCVINDWADRGIDGQVTRTKERMIVSGKVSEKEAIFVFFFLLLMAFILVCFLNTFSILLSFVAVLLAATYPFMKRYTHFPQVILGAAFAWGIPMAYASEIGYINTSAISLYLATVFWTIAFDTIYAMVDKPDDIKIGVKSTAIFFGRFDKMMVAIFQLMALSLFAYWGSQIGLGRIFEGSVIIALLLSLYQQWLIQDSNAKKCFRAFLNSHWIGAVLFLGMWLDFTFR